MNYRLTNKTLGPFLEDLEAFDGEYRIDWSDQKIVLKCTCKDATELDVFSDSATFCPSCGRRYSIIELILTENPFIDEHNREEE
ncbi:hypothetical protein HN747_05045 [archaeon]|jgi:hypothetical protein|nr:hypothetical protein [archaeon]